jgi:hypothetical protein
MLKYIVSVMMVGSLMALQPVRAPINDDYPQNAPSSPSCPRIMSDIITEAFVNYNSNRDYQTNGPTATMLWAVFNEPIKGVYATMMFQNPPGVSGRHQLWNFFDFNTNQWVKKPDTPYLAVDRGGYGNLAVNYSWTSYQYHPFFTAHMDATNYTGDVWWPDTPFDPRNFNGQYKVVPGQETYEVWPHGGITAGGYYHKIFADYDGHQSGVPYAIMYNRFHIDAQAWDGYVPIVTTDDAPWYGFYADPFGKRIVTTYCRTSSDYHIIALIDTVEGDMYYAGMPIQKDITQFIITKFNLPPDWMGFVGDGNPFIDKDGNVHLITFVTPPTAPDTAKFEAYVYHWFYDLSADTMSASFIKQVPAPAYYHSLNTLAAGRSQMGQEFGLGTLYAVWEEFHPTKGVVSSNGYWRAATQVVLGISKDNGKTWTQEVLLVSTNVPGQADTNNWLRFPVISPIIGHSGNLDLVYWGVYFDDDPGFVWRGIGATSTVKMLVGRKEVGVEEKTSISYGKTKINYNGRNITFEIPYKSNVTLKILDASGREINTIYKGIAQGKYNLKIGKVPSGIYFLNLKTEKENINSKIIVK